MSVPPPARELGPGFEQFLKEERDELLAALQLTRRRLEENLRSATGELRRVNRAIAALEAPGSGVRRGPRPRGTRSLLLQFAASLPPDTDFTNADAFAYLQARGWRTLAADPAQAARADVTRMADVGLVNRLGWGRDRVMHFQTLPPPEGEQ